MKASSAILPTLTPRTQGRRLPSIANSAPRVLLRFYKLHSIHQSYTTISGSDPTFSNPWPSRTFYHHRYHSSKNYLSRRNLHETSSQRQGDQALTEELRKLTQSSEGRFGNGTGPTLGPFMMPRGQAGERPLNVQERQGWKEASWSERFKRMIRNGRNVVVVSAGGCIGLLVIYSITSELFAPSSPTNLMLATIDTLERSQSLKTMLRTPYIFHASQHASNRAHPSVPTTPQNFPHTVELRFMIEGSPVCTSEGADWRELDWWKVTIKRWIGPLITSEVKQPTGTAKMQSHSDSVESSDTGNNWLSNLVGSLMPQTLSNRKERQARSGGERPGWLERRSSMQGTFEHGEVMAEIVKDSGGGWTYKSLYVDFPDAQHGYYRLDVLDELRKVQSTQTEEKAATRYRFWSRRINIT